MEADSNERALFSLSLDYDDDVAERASSSDSISVWDGEKDVPANVFDSDAIIGRAVPVSKQSFDDAKTEGEWLLCMLYASEAVVTQSPWTDSGSMVEYGWNSKPPRAADPRQGAPIPLGKIFDDLHLSTDREDNYHIENNHVYDVHAGGRVWRKTLADYDNFYNTGDRAHAIVANTNWGPATWGGMQVPPVTGTDLIPIRQWSDVVFLDYQTLTRAQQQSPESMQKLRYVFRLRITNGATLGIIEAVLGVTSWRETVREWPGDWFGMDTDKGKALLGTPNGRGVAWLLAQHKKQLGRKVVSGVRVFKHAPGAQPSPSLLFYLEDWKEECVHHDGAVARG